MRDLAVLVLVGVMCGCGSENGGSSGTGGLAGAGGTGGTGGGVPLQDEYVLSDQALVPESGTYDSASRSFFVGSANSDSTARGGITRVEADGTETIAFPPPADESWSTRGMIVDTDARRLWVCARQVEAGVVTSQRIRTFDLSTGEQELDLDLASAAEGSTCNDIAVDSAGLAYISDSENSRIYRASAEDETVEVWADDPLLASDLPILGGNGIAVTEDDRFVILSKTVASTPPRLLRIDRTDPASISGITTTPDFVGTADGMSFLDGDLYIAIVNPGEIFRLTSEDDWATAAIASTTAVVGTSTVRPAEGFLYAIYSDITAFIVGEPLSPPFRIFRIDLDSFE